MRSNTRSNKRSQRDLGAHHRMTFDVLSIFFLKYTIKFNTYDRNTKDKLTSIKKLVFIFSQKYQIKNIVSIMLDMLS